MYGAIIGDLAGSIYEFEQTKKVTNIQVKKLIEDNSFFSDDTILTIAILDAILNNGDYECYIKKYIAKYLNYKPDFNPYFTNSFSPNLLKWYYGKIDGVSSGNGCMMRISSVGYLFNDIDKIKIEASLATKPSHNTKEAILGAKTVALIIYYARLGMSKEEIANHIAIPKNYEPFNKFNYITSETLPNCLYALFSSNSFEEAIRKVISYGGDTDTNACIVGSMAEALFGIDDELILSLKEKIPNEFTTILEKGYKKIKNIHK